MPGRFAGESGPLDDVAPLLVDAAARAKADPYAEAAGVRVGAVVHIEDVDPEQPGASRYRSHAEAAATFGVTAGIGVFAVCARTAIQQTVPAQMLSRTMSAIQLFGRGATPVGALCGGALASFTSPRTALHPAAGRPDARPRRPARRGRRR